MKRPTHLTRQLLKVPVARALRRAPLRRVRQPNRPPPQLGGGVRLGARRALGGELFGEAVLVAIRLVEHLNKPRVVKVHVGQRCEGGAWGEGCAHASGMRLLVGRGLVKGRCA